MSDGGILSNVPEGFEARIQQRAESTRKQKTDLVDRLNLPLLAFEKMCAHYEMLPEVAGLSDKARMLPARMAEEVMKEALAGIEYETISYQRLADTYPKIVGDVLSDPARINEFSRKLTAKLGDSSTVEKVKAANDQAAIAQFTTICAELAQEVEKMSRVRTGGVGSPT